MALCSAQQVMLMPGMNNRAAVTPAWLDALVAAVTAMTKKYLKRDIERGAYTEYYSGTDMPDVIVRQYPILSSQTEIAAGSNGAAFSQSTVNVDSTEGFDPAGPDRPVTLAVQVGTTSAQTWTAVTYTGVTPTSFTGVSGGSGTMYTGNGVAAPVVWFDPTGYFGKGSGAFADGTIQVLGSQYVPVIDSGGELSHRGLLRRITGQGAGIGGWYPGTLYTGKLAGARLPGWPKGMGNVKVAYSAGYAEIPLDLSNAAAMLVAYMVRNQPLGAPLSSENLGPYSYSVLTSGNIPEIGEIRRMFAPYRESSW